MISPELEGVLRGAGWTPGRRVDVSGWMLELTHYRFHIVPGAAEILEEFGGLVVAPVRSASDAYAPGPVVFNPLLEAEIDRVEGVEERLGCLLTPIGQVSGQSCLLLSENGSVYTSWGPRLSMAGTSLVDALENTLVFARRRPSEIRMPEEKDEGNNDSRPR